MQRKKRESNYDIIRIIGCFVWISTHITSRYKSAITDPNVFGELLTVNVPVIIVMDTMTRFIVPCFIMLAGAFALGYEKNADYRKYYRKTFQGIWLPTLVFSVLYVLDGMITQGKLVLNNQAGVMAMLDPIKAWILGAPGYHMWYLYATIGMYLLTPILIRWKNSISKEAFRLCAWGLLVLCVVSGWTSKNKFNWDVGFMLYCVGYYVIGYVIRDMFLEKKCRWKSGLLILAGLGCMLVLSWIQYNHSMAGLAESDEVLPLVSTFTPLLALGSVLIFAGFSALDVSFNADWLVKRSFLIYLIHAGVLTRMFRWIMMIDVKYIVWTVLGFTLLILAISFALAVAYEKLWGWIDRKWDVSRRLANWIFPEK